MKLKNKILIILFSLVMVFCTAFAFAACKSKDEVDFDFDFEDEETTIDPLNALTSAFGGVMGEPTTFYVDLDVDGHPINGIIYLDLLSDGSDEISLESVEVRAKIGEQLNVWFQNGSAYVELGDNVHVSLSVPQLLSLIATTQSGDADAAEAAAAAVDEDESSGFDLTDVLTDILSADIVVEDGQANMHSEVTITDSISATLDFNFFVDGDYVTLDYVSADVSVAGIPISAKLGYAESDPPAQLLDTSGYAELSGYASYVYDLIQNENLEAEVSYALPGEKQPLVSGTVKLNTKNLVALGDFNIVYGDIDKNIQVIYSNDGNLYLTIDQLNLKANPAEAVEIVKNLLSTQSSEAAPASDAQATATSTAITDILDKVFGIDFGSLVNISEKDVEGGKSLSVILHGTELLRSFGVNFGLGDVEIGLLNGGITASALGVNIGLGAGSAFTADATAEYYDVTPVLAKLPAIINAQALSIGGELGVTISDGKDVTVCVNEGYITWKDGINCYLDVTLSVLGSKHDFVINITDSAVKVAYGAIGVDVVYNEIPNLSAAFKNVKAAVSTLADKLIVAEKDESTVEAADTLAELIDAADVPAAPSWTKLVQSLTLGNSDKANGVASLTYKDFSIHILDEMSSDGFLAVALGLKNSSIKLTGALGVNTCAADLVLPAMPTDGVKYYNEAQLAKILDYVTAAANTLTKDQFTVTFNGSAAGKYDTIKATLSYNSPNGFPITINTDRKSVVIDDTAYLNLKLELVPASGKAGDSLYLDLSVLDGVLDGGALKTDNVLDFYVSISRYGSDSAAEAAGQTYAPLSFHAPADEICTLLSEALVMFGVDNSILNDFFITKYITNELGTKDQLLALGNIIKPLLFGSSESDGAEEDEVSALAVESHLQTYGLFKDFYFDAASKEHKMVLNGSVFGQNVKDIEIGISKTEGGEDTLTLLSSLSFNYGEKEAAGNVNGNIAFNFDTVTKPETITATHNFTGIDELLLSLARSVTHDAAVQTASDEVISGDSRTHNYVVNNYFYIDGDLAVNLGIGTLDLIEIKITLVAVSLTIDEDNNISLNLRLQYDGLKKTISGLAKLAGYDLADTLIEGRSTLDLSLSMTDKMVYMRRVQTTDSQNKNLSAPITVYRAMPMENFMGDMVNQLCFMLNLQAKLQKLLTDMISIDGGSSDGGGDESRPAPVDYGNAALSSFNYSATAEGVKTWDIVLLGKQLTGVLEDISIKLNTDNNGLINTLTLNSGLKQSVINIGISANFTWYNAGGKTEFTDKTDKTIADIISNEKNGMGGMINKLNANDGWATQKFLEAQQMNVTFKYVAEDGTETDLPGGQSVMVASDWKQADESYITDGNPKYTLYSVLDAPALPEANVRIYYDGNDYGVGSVIPESGVICYQNHKQVYGVTFYSKDNVNNEWTLDSAKNLYYKRVEMEYGAEVKFDLMGVDKDVTLKISELIQNIGDEVEVVIEDKGDFTAVDGGWSANLDKSAAVFTAMYKSANTVKYNSVVTYSLEVDGQSYVKEAGVEYSEQYLAGDYTLITPTAQGYTFLGWYQHVNGSWQKVESLTGIEGSSTTTEVEALWAGETKVEMTNARGGKKGLFSANGWYGADITITVGDLRGAFAEGATVTTSKAVQFFVNDDNNTSDGKDGSNSGMGNLLDGFTLDTNTNVKQYESDHNKGGSANKKFICVEVIVTYTVDNNETVIAPRAVASAEVSY